MTFDVPPGRRKVVSSNSLQITRAGLETEQSHALAAEAECQHEESRAAVFAGLWVANQRISTVVDLCFLTGRGENDSARFRTLCAALFANEAFDAFVGASKTMPIHEFLPDRHGIAATHDAVFDEFAVGFADAGYSAKIGGRFCDGRRLGVGGHPISRFYRCALAPCTRRTNGDVGRLEILACGFATDSGCLLDAP